VCSGGFGTLDVRNESIASTRKSFHKPWVLGGIAERLANLANRAVQSEIEVDERTVGPELLAHFLARHDLTWTCEQKLEDF
jgi:hypothetical protein